MQKLCQFFYGIIFKMKILIVDDENLFRISIAKLLKNEGYSTYEASSVKEAKEIIIKEEPEIVLLDVNLPDGNGIDLLEWAISGYPDILFIMLTAYGKVKDAINTVKKGAFNYLEKPIEAEEILLNIKKAEEHINLKRELIMYKKRDSDDIEIIASSQKMQEVLRLAHTVARSEARTILLQGESGTGKDLIAKYIHLHSRRRDNPFLVLNSAAVPENLLESEIFGYEKGAFTDAKTQKKGLLELANGGTLFLDEIGELKINLQAKILRFLEDGVFKRLGGLRDIQTDVMFISATNRDLKKDVEEKLFREDLYYRISVFPIYIPPLRERKEDILPLAKHFINIYNRKFNKKVLGFKKEAEKSLLEYEWYGNAREIRNVIERTMILINKEYIDLEDLNIEKDKKNETRAGDFSSLEAMEIKLIKDALKDTNYNVSKAAKLLKITRDKLRYKIKKYKLNKEEI